MASESRTIIPGPGFFFLKAYSRMIPKEYFRIGEKKEGQMVKPKL